ncbi:legumain [Trichonephila clavipes]|uniref:Legumain n=1 Tax=Trichonephila clavipes TaxID=2585209 RepID=A0A8X6RDF4_TRICX|nr:legumain [Trichonephila clavipes]
MYRKKRIYIEACEFGSMFENILPNIKVYATTAANSEESTYAYYFVDKRDTYLGDSYSVHWMEDFDQEVLTTETLQKQYKTIKKETTESHAQEFGDMSIAKLHVSEEKVPRQLWRLGRIIEIHKGRDSKVRSATIKTLTEECLLTRDAIELPSEIICGTVRVREGKNHRNDGNWVVNSCHVARYLGHSDFTVRCWDKCEICYKATRLTCDLHHNKFCMNLP